MVDSKAFGKSKSDILTVFLKILEDYFLQLFLYNNTAYSTDCQPEHYQFMCYQKAQSWKIT